jgi:hypothetical protein
VCDVFNQSSCPLDGRGNVQGCYATFSFGEGYCSAPYVGNNAGTNGSPCMYLNGCNPGFGCHPTSNGAVCRPYCRTGANAVPCMTVGATCLPLSAKSPSTDTVGVCSM